MPTSSSTPLPPQPPDLRSRLRLSPGQRVGLPLMMLVPILAVAGVFGERQERRHAASGALQVEARVPTRLRYRQHMSLDVTVTNGAARPLDDVRVRLDQSYLDHFSGVSFTPEVSPDGSVAFGTLAAGGKAQLTIGLDGDRAGTFRGSALVTDALGDSARVALTSTVFP